MAVPRIKKAKTVPLAPPKIVIPKLNRKCRSCGRWSLTSFETCPWCNRPYGRLVLGDDLPDDVSPAVDKLGFPVEKAEL